jgi:hypothetical protein
MSWNKASEEERELQGGPGLPRAVSFFSRSTAHRLLYTDAPNHVFDGFEEGRKVRH